MRTISRLAPLLALLALTLAPPAGAFLLGDSGDPPPIRAELGTLPCPATAKPGERYRVPDADGAVQVCTPGGWAEENTGEGGGAPAGCGAALQDRDGDGVNDFACVEDRDTDGELQDDLRAARNALVWPSGTLTTAPRVAIEISTNAIGAWPLGPGPAGQPNGPWGSFVRFCADSSPPTGENEPDCTGTGLTTSHPDLELVGMDRVVWEWALEHDDLYPPAGAVVGRFGLFTFGDYIADGADAALWSAEVRDPIRVRVLDGDGNAAFIPDSTLFTTIFGTHGNGVCGRFAVRGETGDLFAPADPEQTIIASPGLFAAHPSCARLDVDNRGRASLTDGVRRVGLWGDLSRVFVSGVDAVGGVVVQTAFSSLNVSPPLDRATGLCSGHPHYSGNCGGPHYTSAFVVDRPGGTELLSLPVGSTFDGTVLGTGADNLAVCDVSSITNIGALESVRPTFIGGVIEANNSVSYTCRFTNPRVTLAGVMRQLGPLPSEGAAAGRWNENNPWLPARSEAAGVVNGTLPAPVHEVFIAPTASFEIPAANYAGGQRPFAECHSSAQLTAWVTAPTSKAYTWDVAALASTPSAIASNGALPAAVCAQRDGTVPEQCGLPGAATSGSAIFAEGLTWVTGVEVELLEDALDDEVIDVGVVVDTRKDKSGTVEPWDTDGADDTPDTADDGIGGCGAPPNDVQAYVRVGRSDLRVTGDKLRKAIGLWAEPGESLEVALKDSTATTLCADGAGCATSRIPALRVTVHYFDASPFTRVIP